MEVEFNKELSDEIYSMYFDKRIGFNPICIKCKAHSKKKKKELVGGPVPIFHVGSDYNKNEKKLLLIGRVAYGWNNLNGEWDKTFNEKNDSLYEIQKEVENISLKLFLNKEERYFKYLNHALIEVFKNIDVAFNNIAITNLVHCNTGCVRDNLPQKVRNYCVNNDQNGFIFKEIEILKPTHIIVLTKDFRYLCYIKNTWKSNCNFIAIDHPSSSGRTKDGFASDILNFWNKQHDII